MFQVPQLPPTDATVMPPMFELLAPMIVPRSQNWDVGGAVMVVWSRPAPWMKHHGFSVTCSL